MKLREEEEKRRKIEMKETVSSGIVSKLVVLSESESEFSGIVIDEVRSDRNVVPIPIVALEADRNGVSNRAAAAICTASLIDYGIV